MKIHKDVKTLYFCTCYAVTFGPHNANPLKRHRGGAFPENGRRTKTSNDGLYDI
ncbi:unknown [Prevotella sp. CAG:1124]|nr:unknown [Prevotella sp. CAG:1124]